MIKLNVNSKKKLQFDVSVSGVQTEDLKGSMKIVMEKIEYGFPISIIDGKIVVEIPALNDFIKEESLNEDTVKASLGIIANDTYIVPWEDSIIIESPVKVEAIMSDIQTIMEKELPKIEIKSTPKVIVEEIDDEVKKVKKIEKKTKSKFAKAMG